MLDKKLFTVSVFGLAAVLIEDAVRIMLNIRTDQDHQWKIAGSDPISGVFIVDCPGGGVLPADKDLASALRRQIIVETGGCDIVQLGKFMGPIPYFNLNPKLPSDLAFWTPIRLIRQPKPSDEAFDHPWVSREEFEADAPFRCVSALGNKGRTGQMVRAAFEFFEANANLSHYFCTTQ